LAEQVSVAGAAAYTVRFAGFVLFVLRVFSALPFKESHFESSQRQADAS